MTQRGSFDGTLFSFVDLFAGCGGLSLGLRSAGGRHVLAVEKSPMAAETYFKNLVSRDDSVWRALVSSSVRTQAASGLVVGPLSSVLADSIAMKTLREEELDVVAGGPPCQGFSMAGKRQKDDPRNALALEFLSFVNLTDPKFVIIENVLGMHRKFDVDSTSTPFEEIRSALAQQGSKGGYRVQGVLLNSKHYGVPQSRPRMMLLGVREDIALQLKIDVSDRVQKSGFTDDINLDHHDLLPPAQRDRKGERHVRDALLDLSALGILERSAEPEQDYLTELNDLGRWKIVERQSEILANTALRKHRQQTQRLFAVIEALKGLDALAAARRAKANDYSGAVNDEFVAFVGAQLAKFPLKTSLAGLVFDTPAQLIEQVMGSLTRKHSQTVLAWNEPARTVVTIPDDYIHPRFPRTFSVRELARLQGFPDSFEFHGKVTTGGTSRRTEVPQYTQVGNAVSPFVGLALGNLIAGLIDKLNQPDPSEDSGVVSS